VNATTPKDNAAKPMPAAHFENLNSIIPNITDYPQIKQRKEQVAPRDEDHFHDLFKTNRALTTIEQQSLLQYQLQKGQNVNKDLPPKTHDSLRKRQKTLMEGRPLFGAPSNRGYEGAVNQGRQRMFYHSQVF